MTGTTYQANGYLIQSIALLLNIIDSLCSIYSCERAAGKTHREHFEGYGPSDTSGDAITITPGIVARSKRDMVGSAAPLSSLSGTMGQWDDHCDMWYQNRN